jgi:hypothetical protein
MRFDDYAFEQCARAVYIMNDSARELYDSWEELRSFMESMAYQYGGNAGCTHFETGGFCLSFSRSSVDREDWFVTASIEPYTALRYIKSMQIMQRM